VDSDAVWEGEWERLREGGYRGGYRRREGAVLGLDLGHSDVTNGDFVMRLFQNYFGQYLLILLPTRLVAVHCCRLIMCVNVCVFERQQSSRMIFAQ